MGTENSKDLRSKVIIELSLDTLKFLDGPSFEGAKTSVTLSVRESDIVTGTPERTTKFYGVSLEGKMIGGYGVYNGFDKKEAIKIYNEYLRKLTNWRYKFQGGINLRLNS